MSDENDIWLCTFESKKESRTEKDLSLLFNLRNNRFQIRVSQDYDTQSQIGNRFLDADDYFAEHPEHRDTAMKAIADYLATNSAHDNAMKAAMSRMKSL